MPGDSDRDAGVDPRFDPVFQRGYDPAVHRRPKRPSEPARSPRPVPDAPSVEPVERLAAPLASGSPEHELPARNPFRVALLLTSLAAIVSAPLLLWRRLDVDPYYGNETARLFANQFLDDLMLPLLTGGIVGLCLWLALGAVRGRDDA